MTPFFFGFTLFVGVGKGSFVVFLFGNRGLGSLHIFDNFKGRRHEVRWRLSSTLQFRGSVFVLFRVCYHGGQEFVQVDVCGLLPIYFYFMYEGVGLNGLTIFGGGGRETFMFTRGAGVTCLLVFVRLRLDQRVVTRGQYFDVVGVIGLDLVCLTIITRGGGFVTI